MTRWLRRGFRRIGIDLPFRQMVCPEDRKQITIDLQWRATVTTRRQMVFLEQPSEGDLYDIVPVDSQAGGDSHLLESPDAVDIGHRRVSGHVRLYWQPRDPIVKYAVYTHERSWNTPAEEVRDVLCTQLTCQSRVAVMAIEIVAPVTYETAVAFKLPWWHWLATERQLMKYALTQIDISQSRPIIDVTRTRVSWKVTRPRVGDRFICIAFTPRGLASCQQAIEDTSIGGRVRRLFGRARGGSAVPGRVLLR